MSSPSPSAVPLATELKELREELAKQSMELKYSQQHQQILDDVRELKKTVDERWVYIKVITAVATTVLSLAGIGVYQWLQDTKKRVTEQIEANVTETRVFYTKLMEGSAFMAQRQYDAAIPRLLDCFYTKGHTYDKSVLIPLLASLNFADDFQNAGPVIEKLRFNLNEFNKLREPYVYATIGAIEVQSAISELPAGKGDAISEKKMGLGIELLRDTFPKVAPEDYGTRTLILTNRWIYHVARREFKEALEMIEALNRLPREATVFSWDAMSTRWICLRALKQRDSSTMDTAAKQWILLKSRYVLGSR